MALTITDTITSTVRDAAKTGGKGHSRKARAQGQLPATVYGPGSEQQFLLLNPRWFTLQVNKFGIGHIYDVEVTGGTGFKAMVKEVQRDYVRDELLHVDLYAVDLKKELRIEVTLEMSGKAKGVIDGGIVTQTQRHIEVLALPNKIPEKLVVDISELAVGESMHLSDIKLPDGVKFTAQNDETVVTCSAPDTSTETPAAGAEAAPASK